MPGCETASCVRFTRHGVIMGQGQRIQDGDGPIEYLWGTWQHGDVAVGYSGDSLQGRIGQLQAQQAALQAKLDAYDAAAKRKENDPNAGFKDLVAGVLTIALDAAVTAALCGTGALCATVISLDFAAGSAADHQDTVSAHLADVQQNAALQTEIADLQSAAKNSDTVWYTAPTMKGHR